VLFLPACKDDYTERINQQKELDDKAIQKYLTDNSIQNAQRQPSGVYYVPNTPGNGTQIKRGNTVVVNYILRDLNNQKIESTFDTGQPKSFVVGASGIIPGLTEGFLLMQNGEKAKLIIPSLMGYGQYTSILVYEITILEVK
jgi:FKBP-type peptidyl-prolyl cis-trans isomerase